jgi:ABC-type glutathione transport system ATPase component
MIEAEGIVRTYKTSSSLGGERTVYALRGVDFTLPDGGAVSFIGESGCGKTTLGKVLTGLEVPDEGKLLIDGTDVLALPMRKRGEHLRRVQMVHQDPYSALNPTHTVDQILGAPLKLTRGRNRGAITARAAELLDLVGLDPYVVLPKYPHQLSGGQRQRVVIARALTVDPAVLVADEAVSMIDYRCGWGSCACCATCAATWASRCCSSPTTSPPPVTSVTAARSGCSTAA